MTEDNYIELEDRPEDDARSKTETGTEAPAELDPLAREQIVNRTRDFFETDEPYLSPWAQAAAAQAAPAQQARQPEAPAQPAGQPEAPAQTVSADETASQAAPSQDTGQQEPAAQAAPAQAFDPYARPNRYGAKAETPAYGARTEAPVYGQAPSYAGTATARAPKKREPKYVSLRGFIIGMICCMLATSGITVGALGLGGVFDKGAAADGGKVVSATNYTLAEATGNEKSIEEIVAMNENAVVEIMTESVMTDSWLQSYVTQGAGSGIIIDSRGYIMTCNHVISGARSITVTLKTGEKFSASVIGTDPANDVAVIKIQGSGFVAATYGNSDSLSVGDLAVAIGNPLGQLGGTATTGIISALDRELTIDGKNLTLLQTDASINPGNSGGGLFDGEGNLIGLVVAKSGGSNVEGLGFAIPINTAAPIVKEMIESGPETKTYIGISVLNVDTEEMAQTYGFDSVGVFITEVTSVEARSAGLEKGDKIISVGGADVSDYDSLSAALAKHEPGDKVTVTVIREGETVEVETTLIAG